MPKTKSNKIGFFTSKVYVRLKSKPSPSKKISSPQQTKLNQLLTLLMKSVPKKEFLEFASHFLQSQWSLNAFWSNRSLLSRKQYKKSSKDKNQSISTNLMRMSQVA